MIKRNIVKFHILIVCISFCQACYAQKQGKDLIDSLNVELRNYKSECIAPCIKDSSKVELLLALAWEYNFNKPDTVLALCNDAISLSKEIKYDLGIAQSYHVLGNYHNGEGSYDTACFYFSRELDILDRVPAAKGKTEIIFSKRAAAYNSMGNVFKSTGNHAIALDYFLKAMTINQRYGNKYPLAINKKNIGDMYKESGNYKMALQYYFMALKLGEELNKKNIIASTFGSIGLVFRNIGNYQKSLEYYAKAIEINKALNDKKGVGTNLNNIGVVYQTQNNFEKAIAYQQMALKEFKEAGYKKGMAGTLTNIGSIYSEWGEKKSGSKNFLIALEYLFQALKIQEQLGRDYVMAINLENIGLAYLHLRNYAESEKYLIKSLALSDSINDLEGVENTNEELSKFYAAIGNDEKALMHYRQAMFAKDSLFKMSKADEITRQEMNYDFEKRAALAKVEQERREALTKGEIERQKLFRNAMAAWTCIISTFAIISFFFYKRKRDTEQLQKETALSLQVSETEMKALRSQMNPHFIFNALQSIQTFLMNHKADEANIYLLKFSKLMRAVLENSQHQEVSLKKDIHALELYMQLESIRLLHPFTYQFHLDESVNLEETTIPPLILQPFVENAIWHGLQYKTEPGHINIYIRKMDNVLHAIVEDNGVGRDMSKQANQPMLLKKESLGMKLTEERLKVLNELKKIRAQFKITDLFTKENRPAGTRVELTLP